MKRLILSAALCFPVVASAADAIGSAAPVPPNALTFQQLDTNRDGLLSFSEAFPNARAANAFNILDTNADGFLSPTEFAAIYGR
jgi:hypothetical protein